MSRVERRDLSLVIFKTLLRPSVAFFLLFTAVALAQAEPADPLPASRDALRAEALANDGDSQFRLGEMLLNNPTDMNDLVDAYAWFVLADRNGHARARYYKRGMGNVLDEEQQQQVAERVADLTAAIAEGRDPDAAEDSGAAAADAPVADTSVADTSVTDTGPGQSGQADEGRGAEAPAGAPATDAGSPDGAASADLQAPVPADDTAASGAPSGDDAGGREGQGAEPAAEDTARAPADSDGPEDRQPEAAAPGDVPPDSLDNDSPANNVTDGGGGSTTSAAAQGPHPQAEQPQTEPRSQDQETGGDADQPNAAASRESAPGPAQVPEQDPAQIPARDSAQDAAAVPVAPAPAAAAGGTTGVAGSVAAAPAAPDVAPGSRAAAAVDPSALVVRGRALLAQGDIVSARALFELAAESGSGEAALLTGRTYDPGFVAEHKAVGFRGNAEQARRWYRMAIEMGAPEAQAALDQLAQ